MKMGNSVLGLAILISVLGYANSGYALTGQQCLNEQKLRQIVCKAMTDPVKKQKCFDDDAIAYENCICGE